MFYIWDEDNNSLWGRYDNKRHLDNEIKYIKDYYPSRKMRIGEYEDSYAWRVSRDNLKNGTWSPPVWADKPFAKEEDFLLGTFVHVYEQDPQFLEYYSDKKKLEAGVTTKIKPGKYLKKYYGDKLTSDEITSFVDKHKEQWLNPPELSFAYTPEEIALVYSMDANFSSCMQKRFDIFSNKWDRDAGWSKDVYLHPTFAYGAGDLAVAYVHKGDRLISRAVVWPEKKKVGRIYGDIISLRSALNAQGWNTHSSNESYDSFEGAKLLRLPYTEKLNLDHMVMADDTQFLIGPYIDGPASAIVYDENHTLLVTPEECHDYLRRGVKVFNYILANGVARSSCKCQTCSGETFNINKVVVRVDEETKERIFANLCQDCGRSAAWSTISSVNFDSTKFETVRVRLGSAYTFGDIRTVTGALGLDDIVRSETSGFYYARSETVPLGNGDRIGSFDLHAWATMSDADYKYYPRAMINLYHIEGSTYRLTQEQYKEKVAINASQRDALFSLGERIPYAW